MPRGNRDPPPPCSDLWDPPVTLPGTRRALRSAVALPPPATLPANLTTAAMVAASAARGTESASRAKGKGKPTNPYLPKASGSGSAAASASLSAGVGKFIFYI
jgi:hypothetical protein